MEAPMYPDLHIHSRFSSDSKADLDEIIIKAINLNMEYICITDHQDFDFPDEDLTFNIDPSSYYSTLSLLKEEYSSKINLLIGVETGLEAHLHEEISSFVNEVPFDFVIGSSHLVNRMDPYEKGFFKNHSDKEGFTRYFQSIIDNLNFNKDFDVYGHLDYIVRYSPNKNKNYSYQAFSDYIDEILRKLINMGKGIEINTGGYKYGLGTTNPSEDIIKRYKELGGEIITFASDAHTPEYIASNFDKAAHILINSGFKYYNIFIQREAIFRKL